jgi:hypothetical protein
MIVTAEILMTDHTVRSRQQHRRRPPIIDQEGNEVHGEPFGGGNFSFQDLNGNFAAGGGFGGNGPNFGGLPFGNNLTREQRFARLDALARLLDVAFILPGTNVRYGIDGLIGLIPVIGDVLTTAISLWIVREARALGAPKRLVARMLGNVAIDGVVGIVPFAGDAFDVMFRANMRNMRLLKRWMDKQPRMD